jgi:hypothetical protein
LLVSGKSADRKMPKFKLLYNFFRRMGGGRLQDLKMQVFTVSYLQKIPDCKRQFRRKGDL